MLLKNLTIASMTDGFGLIHDGAIWIKGGLIKWCGARVDVPKTALSDASRDLGGRLITPALIDCHTHIIHGGDRATEFEMRLNGASYEEVARAGGGIVATVAATRAADLETLITTSLPRVDALIAEGVAVIEVKSGYGLDVKAELRMLRAARALEKYRKIRVKTSFLGAHAVPLEYAGRANDYIEQVCIPALRAAHAEGLVDAVDGFCESIAFDPPQIRRVFAVAKSLALPVKLHAEQLSHSGGTKLAAEFGALSADHVEYANGDDACAMAAVGTVAVILPGAYYTIRETQMPPIAEFRKSGVAMALATDCNPGSSPMTSLLLTMNMACTLFRLPPAEALAGITRHAATALGLTDCGMITAGRRADFAIWNVTHPAELAYRIGFNPQHARVIAGDFSEIST